MNLMDQARYGYQYVRNFNQNRSFLKEHPNIALPPDHLIYNTFQLNYRKYFQGGEQTAHWLADMLGKHATLEKKHILDWGCGPGRIIRHLPKIISNGNVFTGTDYDTHSIAWCKKHLHGISFHQNYLQAELPFDNDSMDVIYGISIFTHLSEENHFSWFAELFRVLKPNGILLLTTHGQAFRKILSPKERSIFDSGIPVVRSFPVEGHRMFSTFQPSDFMQQLFKSGIILDHISPASDNKGSIPQDVWIVRKPMSALSN